MTMQAETLATIHNDDMAEPEAIIVTVVSRAQPAEYLYEPLECGRTLGHSHTMLVLAWSI